MCNGQRRRRLNRWPAVALALVGVLALGASACSSAAKPSASTDAHGMTTVRIHLTSGGCNPSPNRIPAGQVTFRVSDASTDTVSEAELRSSNLASILGEQENLTPGTFGGFALNIQPGTYKIDCPGAAQEVWDFTVTGQHTGPSWKITPQLVTAVSSYRGYVNQNAAALVSHTQTFCRALDAGNLDQAKVLYPQARVFYEQIEPVAEIWGTLDTQIDGRWENPVTVPSQFIGFHKIEELLWRDHTLTGTSALCAGLVQHEQQLLTLVHHAQYNPLEMASGATDLINEAATAKITGEEERYSQTDLPVFAANVEGAMEVVGLLQPYLEQKDPGLLAQIRGRDETVITLLAKYQAHPGYDSTGYVSYTAVTQADRRQLSAAVNAMAESLSKLSIQVS